MLVIWKRYRKRFEPWATADDWQFADIVVAASVACKRNKGDFYIYHNRYHPDDHIAIIWLAGTEVQVSVRLDGKMQTAPAKKVVPKAHILEVEALG